MTTPTRTELISSLVAYSDASHAWQTYLHKARTRQLPDVDAVAKLGAECDRAWDALMTLASRLPHNQITSSPTKTAPDPER